MLARPMALRTPPTPLPGTPAPAAAAAEPRWTVRLLGALEAVQVAAPAALADGGPTLSRWPSRAVAGLLARLALAPDRAHPREELIELLWPGVALAVGRNRLRQALSTLKGLLEPPGPHAAQVLHADRMVIRLLPGTVHCDARLFEALARAGQADRARAVYRGELMPGHYDDWVLVERARLAGLADQLDAARRLPTPMPTPMPTAGTVTDTYPTAVAPAPSGLPRYWTRPFGVAHAAARLGALVQARRWVTVHGPGGSGKTRLAVAVAQALRDGPAQALLDAPAPPFDRIVFVPLVQCSHATQALDAVCDALRVDNTADAPGDAAARLVAALAGRRVLLVLDNLEQLADSVGSAITRLLWAAPDVHLLVTSRRLLGLDGESAFELDGLPLPAPDAPLHEAAANPAVALFVDRAQASRADFRLSARHCADTVALVRLLGGMPLAIELAATRLRSLGPPALLQRLRQSAGTPMLDLLARPAQRLSADTRHASMRNVVAWSWQQLTPAEQQLLQSLSVLAGPARPETVAAVAATDLRSTLARLDTLQDGWLVQRTEAPDGSARHSLLQPVREFAAECTPPAAARSARQRLRQWLIGFAASAVPQGPRAVLPELALVHAAITSAPADGAPRDALALAVALRSYWDSDNLPLSDLLALEQALADIGAPGAQPDPDPGADPRLRADALELLAYARGAAGFVAEAVQHANAGLRAAPDDRRRCLALVRWVWVMYYSGRFHAGHGAAPDEAAHALPDALPGTLRHTTPPVLAPVPPFASPPASPYAPLDAALDEAALLARRAADRVAQATVLRMQGLLACNLRLDFAGAEALVAQAQQIWEQLGQRRMVYALLLNRATMWAWQGRNAEALPVFGECERAAQADGDWVSLMQVRWQQGRVLIRLRRGSEAASAFRRSIQIGWQRHYPQALANALLHLPEALVMAGQAEPAARLQGFAVAHWLRLYRSINRIEARELRRTRLLLHLHLGAARAEALRAEGSALALGDAVALALGDAAAPVPGDAAAPGRADARMPGHATALGGAAG